MAPLNRLIPARVLLMAVVLMALLTMVSCSKPAIVDGKAVVDLDGTSYTLDIVADDATRERGLGGVTELPERGGMLFAFPDSRRRAFVMRDCLIDIDIIFLDPSGRIVAMHHMPVEPPRAEGEGLVAYENRLKKYPSRYSAKYAIEILGGHLETMNLQEGQLIELDTEYLESVVK